jgi:uncharacterized protein (TIGR03067 family)
MNLSVPSVFWVVLATTLFQPPGGQPDLSVKPELKPLQGSWQIELQEEDGEKVPADQLKGRSVLFGMNAFVELHNGKMIQLGALKLDASKTPKTVNAMVMEGKQKGDILQGIYALDGDVLKICFDMQGNQRPKEFKTTAGSGFRLMVCKRIRVKGEDQELPGNYRSETVMADGRKFVLDTSIERVGDAYLLTYKKGNAVVFLGVGLRKGDVFCVSWLNQGSVGITLYQIEKGPRLVGQFTELGGPGLLGTEILTRALKEI